ncbi:MAG: hypothetical protein ACHQUA_01595 [Microgenomates group bacterium]
MGVGLDTLPPEPPLIDRINDYLPSPEILEEQLQPNTVDIQRRTEYRNRLPGAELSIKKTDDEKFTIAPAWHPVQQPTLGNNNPGVHYAHVAFEGSTVRPVLDDNGEVTGANLILHGPRMERFRHSIGAIGLDDDSTQELLHSFSQGITDLASMSEHVFFNAKGEPTNKGYIRPWASRVNGIGVGVKDGDGVDMGATICTLGPYLAPEAYAEGATAAAFLDFRREAEIDGKVAGNYVRGAKMGKRARELGAHEVAVFGSYWKDDNKQLRAYDPVNKEHAMKQALQGGILADGIGEDLLYFTGEGRLLYMPKNTNILAGTTRQYVLDYLAPSMGIETLEYPVSLNDIKQRNVIGAAYVGNAVVFCGVKEINVYGPGNELVQTMPLEVTSQIMDMTKAFAREVTGRVETSGPLLTPVDIKGGRQAAAKMKEKFRGWF